MFYHRKKEVYLPGWLWFFLILPFGLIVALLYRQKRLLPIARRLRNLPLPFPSAPRYSEPDSIPLEIRPEIPFPEGVETGVSDFAVVEGRGAPEIILEQPEPPQSAGSHTSTDDLSIIEGIGPKISSLLREAGIVSFAMLANTSQEKLDEILTSARLRRIADPTTWPEQAHLAAAGEWEALQQLQNTLKGGRRASAG